MFILNIVLIIIFICSILFIKEKYNPITCFVGFWLIIMNLSTLGLYGVYVASEKTYNNVSVGVLSFAIGCFLAIIFTKKFLFGIASQNSEIEEVRKERQLNDKLLPYFTVIIIAILLMYFMRTARYMLGGYALNYIRSNFSRLIIHNNIERLLWSFIILPASLAIIPLDLYASYIEKKSKWYIVVSLLNTILLAISVGGRVYLMFYMIQLAFFTIFTPKKDKKRSKLENIVFWVILAAVCIFIMKFISNERQIEESTGESLYVYFTGCFPYLEYKIQQLDLSGFRANGMGFFYGPVTFIEMLLKNFGLKEYSAQLLATQGFVNNLQDYIDIGPTNFNAFASIFYYFYLDAGVNGIILGSSAFGFISYKLFMNVRTKATARYVIIYSMILIAIATSMVRWQFGKPEFFLSLIFIYFLTNKKERDEEQLIQQELP